jgi:hypothetical protein
MGCYCPPPIKEISPRDCGECIKANGGGVVTLMFPLGFVFGVVIPLDLVEPSSLIVRDSVLLVENLDRIYLVCQIRFQRDGVFDNSIG